MVELFTVMLSNEKVRAEINKEILDLYGLTLKEFNEKWDKESLIKAIGDFTNTLEKNAKEK